MKSTVWPFALDHLHQYAFVPKAFSKEECDFIVQFAKKQGLTEALVSSGKSDLKIRKSNVSWLIPCKELDSIYKKLTDLVMNLNNQFFNFDLYGFSEAIQFTNYTAPGEKYGRHIDRYYGGLVRKLSMSVQLTDPKKYQGGDFCLYPGEGYNNKAVMKKEQGTFIIFPSYILHEVKPVTKGERNSIVAWITGPKFK
tara:strand:- start:1112 stop:1699 length:588 start_codon:yes stop_codon:yes gene_type:complete